MAGVLQMMFSGYYTCAKCETVFPKQEDAEWSDSHAEAEYVGKFGEPMGEAREIVCDTCFREFMARYEETKQ